MTLYDVIKVVETIAVRQPAIKMIVRNDVFRINAAPQLRYGVFAWLQGQHSSSLDNSLITYQFTFFYVDRLTDDRGNEIDVQSTGISTLENIIKALDSNGIYVDTSVSYQVFNQRFTDECAGVFVNVSLSVPKDDVCAEQFLKNADFDMSFNSDFLIF